MNSSIIHEHAFNASWWGQPVGIIDDGAFFDYPADEKRKALEQYAWVEYKTIADDVHQSLKLCRNGFFHGDTRIDFRIALDRIPKSPSLDAFEVFSASERPFAIEMGHFRSFEHERFYEIPGVTKELVDKRYAIWACQLISKHPDWCVQVFSQGKLQGWFISQPAGIGLNLVLAMLHRDAHISGMYLYQKACLHYAAKGSRLGWANFSVYHTNTHNIYSELGARFLPPIDWWLWVRP